MKIEESAKDGITLDELARFVARAQREEFPGDTRIRTVAKFGGKMFKVSIDHRDIPSTPADREQP